MSKASRLKLIFILLLPVVLGFLAFWNRDRITKPLDDQATQKKEAFDSAVLDPAATRDMPLEIAVVSPNSEDVPEVRQITVTFNKPMVPLGDFEKLAQNLPVTVEPAIPCHWRWLNRMTLSCELDNALASSNAYIVRVAAGLKGFDGTELKAASETKFTTESWRVVNQSTEWTGPDTPVVTLAFNQPMKLDSLAQSFTSPCGALTVVKSASANFDVTRSYDLRFAKPLGLDRACTITLPVTAASESGPLPGKPFTMKFHTYPEFYVTQISCQYPITAKAPFKTAEINHCDPDAGVELSFSTPMFAKDLADQIKVEPFFGWAAGSYGSPEYFKQNPDEEYSSINLHGPMEGRSKHTVTLANIKDRFGRPLQKTKIFTIRTDDFRPMVQFSEDYGILERDGPRQIAYTAVNLENFNFLYAHRNTPSDVDLWQGFKKAYDQCKGKTEPAFAQKYTLKQTVIKPGLTLNRPQILPLDLKTVAPDYDYGMFLGRAQGFNPMGQTGESESIERCHTFFLVTTDLGIMAKVGFYDSGVWVHSIKTGEPVANVAVALRDYDKNLTTAVTDKDGFAKLDGAVVWDPERNQYWDWGAKNLFVTAQTDRDFSMLPFYTGTRGIHNYDFSNYQAGIYLSDYKLSASQNYLVHAITDRPLYQPGQEVNLKVFARHWEPRTFGLKPALEMQLVVRDSQGGDVFKQDVKLSEFGTASATFKLSPDAPLGPFSIEAKIGKWFNYIGQFDVQEFTLPSFKVKVQPGKEQYQAGEAAGFKTQALYHFGGGVARTAGDFVATFQETPWKPTKPEWQRFAFDHPLALSLSGDEHPREMVNLTLEEGKFSTDNNGDVLKSIALPAAQLKTHGRLQFEAKFQDDKGKTIASSTAVEVLYSDYMVGLKTPEWTYEAKKGIEPEVILVDRNEQPVSGRKVNLQLIHRDYKTVRVRGEGNYFSYQTTTKDTVIDKCEFTSGSAQKGCKLTSKAAGSHYITAESRDGKGRLAQSSMNLYVTGKEYVGWFRENHDRIDIVPDKKSYKVGESIQVLVKNPYPEVDALFTLERFGILKQFRKKLTGGAQIVKVPLDSRDYAPGFNLSVQLIKGRVSDKIDGDIDLGKPSFKMGMTKITVVDPETVIAIESKSDRLEYEPGDEVSVDLRVASPGGSRATELSVAVVDERILQLAGDYEKDYDLHEKFYQMPFGDVSTSQMLSFLIGRRHFGKKGAPQGGDGLSGNVRKNFLPMAYWNPALVTDSSGKASFKFKTPDNLTGWRILVVAVDKENRFGFGGSSFKVTKKVIIEPALPAFLTEGDALNARITVFNRTGRSDSFSNTLVAKGVNLESPVEVKSEIKDQDKAHVEWKVTAPAQSTKAQLTFRSQAGSNNDAAEYSFPIRPFAAYETFSTYGSTTQDKVTEPVQIPAKIRPEMGGIDLIFSASLISHLDDVFRYAFYYPYTCWEQTLVRALMLHNYIQIKDYVSIADLDRDPKKWIDELLATMPKFQYSNGGMAYWIADGRTVDPYLSTFTALGLLWMNQSSVPIPKASSDKLFKYVAGLVNGTIAFPIYYSQNSKATTRAMAVYVMTVMGDKNVGAINKLFEERNRLSLFGKSFLWMAAKRLPETATVADALKKEIYSSANMTSGSIQFQEVNDDGWARILHSTTRTNCNLLTAMLEDDSKSQFVEPLLRWITASRKANRWNNTQENLYCLNAMVNYAKIYERETPDFKITGKAMGEALKPQTFKGFKNPPVIEKFSFTPALVGKETQVTLEKSGPGRLYYTARLRVAYDAVRIDAVNAGMQVTRAYFLKDAKGKWTPQTGDVTLKRGELVRIQMKVKLPAERLNVALADQLPAGLEPLNTALASTSTSDAKGEGDNSQGAYDWDEDGLWWGFYSSGGFYHREMRLQGAQYFANFLPPGNFEVNYIAQAVATGTFNAGPAVVEQMYEPEVYGKSTPAKFTITD